MAGEQSMEQGGSVAREQVPRARGLPGAQGRLLQADVSPYQAVPLVPSGHRAPCPIPARGQRDAPQPELTTAVTPSWGDTLPNATIGFESRLPT